MLQQDELLTRHVQATIWPMRLSEVERDAICSAVQSHDKDAEVYLFGSRTDDSKRGGDIDILVLSKALQSKDKQNLKKQICERIGWQKVDIVIAKDGSLPFVRIALEKGIRL